MSALWTASLAFGTLAALLRWKRSLSLQRYCTVAAAPTAILMCIHNLWQEYTYTSTYEGMVGSERHFCQFGAVGTIIECTQQATIFVFILGVHMFAMRRARSLAENSPERRSILAVSRYLIAYTASYGLWTIIRGIRCVGFDMTSPWWQALDIVSWRLLNLNGAFNYLALSLHAKDSAQSLSHAAVRLHPRVAQIKVQAIDYRAWSELTKAETARIQNENQLLWAELGLSYDQGLCAEADLLEDADVEEARPTNHFARIARFGNLVQ